MKKSKILFSVLILSGMLLFGFGLAILVTPVNVYAMDGVNLGTESTLLNNIRASGGAFLSLGIFILLGAFIENLRYSATIISFLSLLIIGIGRIISIVIDGVPTDQIIGATVIDFVVGGICFIAFLKYKER